MFSHPYRPWVSFQWKKEGDNMKDQLSLRKSNLDNISLNKLLSWNKISEKNH